jgi:phosphohistidine phosphatase
MRLYVLRHAIAADAPVGGSDAARELTDEGRRRLGIVLERARAAGVSPDVILTSPYLRAIQTAEIAADALGLRASPVVSQHLFPNSDVLDFWRELADYDRFDQVMLVGHNPHLSELVSTLVGSHFCGIVMKKAALAAVELRRTSGEPRGELLWLLTPKCAGA